MSERSIIIGVLPDPVFHMVNKRNKPESFKEVSVSRAMNWHAVRWLRVGKLRMSPGGKRYHREGGPRSDR